MSTDIIRSANGGSRTPARPAGPGPIAQTHQAAADLEQQQFEKQAREFAVPTTARPALIVAAEVDTIRQTYTTGQGRLDKLRDVVTYREAVWQEGQGLSPFDVPTDDQRNKAGEFFAKYGVRLAGEQPVAPPNPIKARQDAEKPAAPTPAAAQPRPAAAAAEPRPAPAVDVPGVARGPALLPPPASADIAFVLEQGYACTLHVHAPSWSGVLEQVSQISARLAKMNAKPAPVATAASSTAAAGGGQAYAEAPKCKYHGTPMKESKKPGEFFCPSKIRGTNEYCDYKVTV